ncbi:MAG: hypothetical protein ACREC1_07870 [Methylovirgula sp.]
MAKAVKPREKQKKKADKKQSERFKETARELGCDESKGALDRAFEKIDPKRA